MSQDPILNRFVEASCVYEIGGSVADVVAILEHIVVPMSNTYTDEEIANDPAVKLITLALQRLVFTNHISLSQEARNGELALSLYKQCMEKIGNDNGYRLHHTPAIKFIKETIEAIGYRYDTSEVFNAVESTLGFLEYVRDRIEPMEPYGIEEGTPSYLFVSCYMAEAGWTFWSFRNYMLQENI